MEQITTRFPKEYMNWVRAEAESKDRSIAYILNNIMDSYFKDNKINERGV